MRMGTRATTSRDKSGNNKLRSRIRIGWTIRWVSRWLRSSRRTNPKRRRRRGVKYSDQLIIHFVLKHAPIHTQREDQPRCRHGLPADTHSKWFQRPLLPHWLRRCQPKPKFNYLLDHRFAGVHPRRNEKELEAKVTYFIDKRVRLTLSDGVSTIICMVPN